MESYRVISHSVVAGALATFAVAAHGGGITADVGLTPPVDRWIFRSQLRYVERGNDPTDMGREMQMYAAPLVLAYGLRPNVTIIARQIAFHRRMEMASATTGETGFGDFTLLSKWRLFRLNRRDYIIGIAPTIGLEVPTGDDDFGSDTWDGLLGTFLTGRRGPWGADLNLEYKANGLGDRSGRDGRPGDELTANLALSYQFILDENATMSLWPVLELTYAEAQRERLAGNNLANSGGEDFLLAPGLRFARQSFMLEVLLQFPVEQNPKGAQLDRKTGGLVGLRYLF